MSQSENLVDGKRSSKRKQTKSEINTDPDMGNLLWLSAN